MQTLNVGAGQTDTEYKRAEDERRADLFADGQSDANFFFWAAGLAVLGTGLVPLRLNIFSIGAIDFLGYYGTSLGPLYPLAVYVAPAMWVSVLVGLGLAGRSGRRWAFLAGIALYGADGFALLATFSFWPSAVHGIFVFKWFQGQRTMKELAEAQLRKLRAKPEIT